MLTCCHMKMIWKTLSNVIKFTAHRSSGLIVLHLISHLTVIFISTELSSDVCSLSAGYGEPSTAVHIYYSCHSLLVPVSPTLCSHHSPRLPVAVSLFISPSVTNLHHLPVSNFQFFPSLFPFTRCRSLSLSLFHTSPQSPSDAPITSFPSLSLCVSVTLSGLLPSSPASLLFSALFMSSL